LRNSSDDEGLVFASLLVEGREPSGMVAMLPALGAATAAIGVIQIV